MKKIKSIETSINYLLKYNTAKELLKDYNGQIAYYNICADEELAKGNLNSREIRLDLANQAEQMRDYLLENHLEEIISESKATSGLQRIDEGKHCITPVLWYGGTKYTKKKNPLKRGPKNEIIYRLVSLYR